MTRPREDAIPLPVTYGGMLRANPDGTLDFVVPLHAEPQAGGIRLTRLDGEDGEMWLPEWPVFAKP